MSDGESSQGHRPQRQHDGHSGSEQKRNRRFERLVSDLSHHFVILPAEEIDHEVEAALRRIVEFFDAGRALIDRISDDQRFLIPVSAYSVDEVNDPPEIPVHSMHPYLWPQVLSGEPVIFSSLDELPDGAGVDRESFRKDGVESYAGIVVRIEEVPRYLFSLMAPRSLPAWNEALIPRIRLVAEVLANALARKESESALRESERGLSEAQRIARIGNWKWDIELDEVSWSSELFRILGYTAGEDQASRAAFFDRVHPEDQSMVGEKIAKLVSDGEPFAIDHRIVLPDRSTRFLHSMAMIERGPDGRPVRLFGVAQDISDRKKNENELKLKDSAIESSLSGIAITDLDGHVVYVNDSLVRMWGYDDRDEILGKQLPEFWHGDRVMQTVQELRDNGHSTGEDIGKKKDGSLFPVEYSASLLTDADGKPANMFGSFVDVTEKKRAQEEILDLGARLIGAQEEERSRIARELHDDVSQRVALLAVELEYAVQVCPESGTELAEKIGQSVRRLQELASDIHGLSYRLHPRSLERVGLRVAMKSLCREMGEQKKFELDFQEGKFPDALSDEAALCIYRVAQESLRNVVLHSRAKKVDVIVRADDGEFRLTVKDDGIGHDPEAAEARSGLGIIGMRERLRAIGGRLSIRSAPGEGTTVEAVVPLGKTPLSEER